MRKINKGNEPEELTKFKNNHSSANYNDLTQTERQAIRLACSQEQFYLCSYCCRRITGENTDTMNEHVEAQDSVPNRTLDFTNIVASCKTPKQCDASHGAQELPLTPLMIECETELRFKLSGRVEGCTERACDTIRVLNLGDYEKNNKRLIEMRRQLVDQLIFTRYGSPENLKNESDDILGLIIEELSQPEDGKLEPFAPVLVNILKN